MPITDTAVPAVRPDSKPVKLIDEKGLYLIVPPADVKWWWLDFRFDGKEGAHGRNRPGRRATRKMHDGLGTLGEAAFVRI